MTRNLAWRNEDKREKRKEEKEKEKRREKEKRSRGQRADIPNVTSVEELGSTSKNN